jgi:hypothetical protein
LALVGVTAALLLLMGRVAWCECGTVKLWHGVKLSSENSQHLTDWYSLSHIVHGIVFYAGLWLVARHWPMGLRAVAAIMIAALWEIAENTEFVIHHYREVTISSDYNGDSIVNSMADIGFMLVGFMLAGRGPPWMTAMTAAGLEINPAWAIHDNLMLNVLMLLWPLEAIKAWQMGG